MNTSPAGIEFIRKKEGVRLSVYDDNGHPCVGYGHDLTQQEIVSELEIQNNAEEIKTGLYKTIDTLSQSELNVEAQLNELAVHLSKLAIFHPQIKEITERLQSCIIELKDISNEAASLEEKVLFDTKLIEQLTQRLDLIFRLEKKHNVASVAELLEIYQLLDDAKFQALMHSRMWFQN